MLVYRNKEKWHKAKENFSLHKMYKKLCLLHLLCREGYVESVGLKTKRFAHLILNKGNSFNPSSFHHLKTREAQSLCLT